MDNTIYKVTTAELTSVASAIRTKLGITSSISYPFIRELKMLGGKPYTFSQIMLRTISGFSEPINLSYIEDGHFIHFSQITSVNAPNASYIGISAFANCQKLSYISFPTCTNISNNAFSNCPSLTTVSFPVCTNIGSSAFYRCYNLLSLYLLGSSLVSLYNKNAFTATPISNYTTSTGGVYGSIYVPQSLVSAYKSATNWKSYSARIVGI